MLNVQLDLLRHDPFERQRKRIIDIASALEDLGTAIPVVAAQIELIADIQTDEWWVDVSYPMLEDARKRLRNLVQLIERTRKTPLYSDFIDELGESIEIDLPGTGGSVGSPELAQFQKKAEHFLKENLANDIVAKVHSGAPINAADMDELQRVLVAAGIGDTDTFAQASERAGSFALFVRSLVGLDRAAAKRVLRQIPRRQALQPKPDHLRQPSHRLPHRTRHHRPWSCLRLTIHRRRPPRPRRPFRRYRPRRFLQNHPTPPQLSHHLIRPPSAVINDRSSGGIQPERRHDRFRL